MVFGVGGENVGRAFVSLHANGDDVPDEIGDALDDLEPKFREAGEKHAGAYNEAFTEENDRDTDEFVRSFGEKFQKTLPWWDKVKDKADSISESIHRITDDVDENDEHSSRWLERFHDRLVGVNNALDESASRTGAMFGKGSRNDFVNLIGASVEGLNRLINVVPKAGEKLTGLFTGAEGGGGTDFAKLATTVGSSIIGIVLAVSALALVAGPAASLILGLSAAVIGLVASLGFAAAAIGGVALALAGPLAVGAGVVIAALIGMDDQTRKTIFKSIDPLINKFKEAGDAAGEAFGPKLAKAVDEVGPRLDGLTPLFRRVGDALGDVTLGWAKMTESKGFKQFQEAMSDFIPGALRDIGDAVGSTFGGIGGIMRAAIPITEDFLDWLVKITDEFSDWANSKKGQQQLLNFFDDAADSAKAVGGFVKDAIIAVANLLDSGKDSGDSLFTEMGDQLQRFTDYLTDPKNQDAIKDFFANGIDVAEELGHAILAVADAVGQIDTPQSREFLTFLFHAFELIIAVMAGTVTMFDDMVHAISRAANATGDFAGTVVDKIGDAADAVGDFFSAIPKWAGKAVDGVVSEFRSLTHRSGAAVSNLPGRIDDIIDKVAYNAGQTVGRTVRWFAGLVPKTIGAIADLPSKMSGVFDRAADRAIDVAGRIISWFERLPERIAGALAGLWGAIKGQFLGAVEGAKGIADDIVHAFTGLAGRILSAIGHIDIGSLISIPGGAVGNFVSGFVGGITGHASGGVLTGPQVILAGEAGAEAIVPLNRPLSQVDPSVRGLSALAQGLGGGGKTVDASGWTIVTSGPDPYTVAREVVNDFAAKALF